MLEIIGDDQTASLVFFNIFLLSVVIMIFRKSIDFSHNNIINNYTRLGIFLSFIFCLFAFWGMDWFHLANAYPFLKLGQETHMEDVYGWLITDICPDYIVFRTVVWGVGLILLAKMIKMLPVSSNILWYLFSIFGLLWFSYARVSLAMVMMFCGIAYMYNNHRLSNKIFGLVLLLSSYFFHKTALFGIVIILVAALMSHGGKRTFILFSLMIVLSSFFLTQILNDFITVESDNVGESFEHSIESAQGYLLSENKKVGIGALLQKITERVPYGIIAYCCFKIRISQYFQQIPGIIKIFINSTFLIFILSFFLLFDFGVNTSVLAERLFRYSFIPAVVIMSFLYENKLHIKLYHYSFIIGIIGISYTLLYTLYMNLL